MKKYLEDLEKELTKLKISSEDIKEIIADHMEMIEAAYEDGMDDDDLKSKFGEPDQVAKTLYRDEISQTNNNNSPLIEEGELKGYSLFKAFPVALDLRKINISLVSEDFMLFPYDGESIEVYIRKVYNQEDYEVSYIDNVFTLKRNKSKSLRIFGNRKQSGKFGIRVPRNLLLEGLIVKVVSADGRIDNLNTNKMDLKTTSGDFEISNIVVEDHTLLTSVSGDFEISSLKSKELEISLVSGDVDMRDVHIKKDIDINSVSGDVEAKNVKASHVSFRTVSGDFEGEETYIDSCEVKSVSGDFEINNRIHDQEIVVTHKKTLSGDVTIN